MGQNDDHPTSDHLSSASNSTKVSWWQCWRWPLAIQILLGLVLGAGVGALIGMSALSAMQSGLPASVALEQRWDMRLCRLIGGLFMDA
jgi:hypothetical protein